MKLPGSQLKHLPVETISGDQLGKVQDFEFDSETHEITTYLVAPSRLVQPLQRTTLRINRSQVRSISPDRMVVDDGVRRERAASTSRPRIPKPAVPAISTRG